MASSKLPRRFHQFYAWFASYFWIPCPLCGECYGGHEWVDSLAKIPKIGHPGMCVGVCNDCIVAAQFINEEFYKNPTWYDGSWRNDATTNT